MPPTIRGRRRERRRPPSGDIACVLAGTLRFVDGGGRWAALAVGRATSGGRSLVGATITLDLLGARLTVDDLNGDGERSARDLLPGDDVRVTARLRHAAGRPPSMVRVRRLTATAPATPA
jgi:hypothetical protein